MTEEQPKPTEETKSWKLGQTEAAYVPLSVTRGKACANCRWLNPNGESSDYGFAATCHLVDSYPEPILATGLCNRHEAKPQPVELGIVPMPVVVYDASDIDPDTGELERALSKPSVIQRIWESVKALVAGEQSVTIGGFKALDDGKHWVAWHTNNFEDREEEIIAASAHDAYVRRLDTGLVPLPELWFWHIPGTAHGKALWVDRIDHMMVAVGTFDSDDVAKAFQKHYAKGVKYAVSHGFRADKSKHFRDGVWYDYNTFEISPLPLQAAANPFTLFTEVSMVSEEKLAALEAIIGKEAAAQIVSKSKEYSQDVEALGARYKEFIDPAAPPQSGESAQDAGAAFAPLVLALAEAQGVFAGAVKGLEAQAATNHRQLTDALAELAQVKQQLALTPRASQAAGTQLPDAEAEKMKERLPGEEFDPFWMDMKVPLKR